MEQSPSSEADSHSASQEIPTLLRNLKVYYRFHRSPPLVSILSQLYPVHIVAPCWFKVHFSRSGLRSIPMGAICKIRGLTFLLRVGTLWRCGDGLFFEVSLLPSDAILTTIHPLLENVLQTVDYFEISCLGAPFS
jgi:hypothetical protein